MKWSHKERERERESFHLPINESFKHGVIDSLRLLKSIDWNVATVSLLR